MIEGLVKILNLQSEGEPVLRCLVHAIMRVEKSAVL